MTWTEPEDPDAAMGRMRELDETYAIDQDRPDPESATAADSDVELEEAMAEMAGWGGPLGGIRKVTDPGLRTLLVQGLNFEKPSTFYHVTEVVEVSEAPTHSGYGRLTLPRGQSLVRITGRMPDGLCTRYYAPSDRVMTMHPADIPDREDPPEPIDPREYL